MEPPRREGMFGSRISLSVYFDPVGRAADNQSGGGNRQVNGDSLHGLSTAVELADDGTRRGRPSTHATCAETIGAIPAGEQTLSPIVDLVFGMEGARRYLLKDDQ